MSIRPLITPALNDSTTIILHKTWQSYTPITYRKKGWDKNLTATPREALALSMSGRPRSELASEEASAMPWESVRQIQLKNIVFFFVSLSWVRFFKRFLLYYDFNCRNCTVNR